MEYQFGEYCIDTRNYRLLHNGAAVELEPKVFDLLAYLIANRERLVTRDELFAELWPKLIVSDNSLSNQVKVARRAIGDDGKSQRCIKTCHGRGYQFIAAVEEREIPGDQQGAGHLQLARNRPGDGRPSIAVLPFANLNGNPEQEYISDGITEDILFGLCRFRNLLVIARGSVFLLKGKPMDPVEVADRLGAEYLLEGSVRIYGDRVRITAELIDGSSGKDLWSETYDRVLDDIFSVQDDVTQRIVATLATRLEKAGREVALRKAADQLTIYDILLRARHCYPDWEATREGTLQARQLYLQALDLDPDCAAAWSGLACTYNLEFTSDWCEDREQVGERSFEYARKALSLDDRDSNAHMILACAYRDIRADLDLALLHIGKAIDANPNDYWNYCCRSNLLTLVGKLDESIECSHEAIRRSPLLPDTCLASIGFAEYFSERYTQAAMSFGESLHPKPHIDAYIAACYALLERPADASSAAASFRERNGREPMIDAVEDADSWRRFWNRHWYFRDPKQIDHLLLGLREAGIVK